MISPQKNDRIDPTFKNMDVTDENSTFQYIMYTHMFPVKTIEATRLLVSTEIVLIFSVFIKINVNQHFTCFILFHHETRGYNNLFPNIRSIVGTLKD